MSTLTDSALCRDFYFMQQREIKFKYIHSDGKSFIVKVFTLDDITNGDPFEVLSDNPMLKNFRCISRLQYTGLKDKNGTEIYEGDILLIGFHAKMLVVYYKGGFKLKRLWGRKPIENRKPESQTSQYTWDTSKVIGNIHQTPEMLK